MRWIIGLLGILTIFTFVVALVLWLTQHPIATAIILTATGGLCLLFIITTVWGAASWWTVRTMERGAGIALQAQRMNDNYETRKATALMQLIKEGIKVGRVTSDSSNRPALHLPSQELGWLPEISPFTLPEPTAEDGSENAL